jgi:PAS domain S-box-containing protein
VTKNKERKAKTVSPSKAKMKMPHKSTASPKTDTSDLPLQIPPEELAHLLLNSSGEGIYGIDTNGDAIFVNAACARILGFASEDELMGKHMHNLIHHTRPDGSPYPAEECQIYQALREQKGTHVDDEVLFRADGTSFPAEYWSYPMIRDGELVGAVITLIDITDRLQMHEDMIAARKQAESANKAKSAFLANMSHELRTPMNAIIGYSEMLAEDAEDEGLDDMLQDLNKITAAGRHLLSLINDVLDLSKIEAGKMDLHLETFSLIEMLDEVSSTAASLLEKNDNKLVCSVSEDVGEMHADMTKIRQILFNLISNAAKFTKDGTITLQGSRELRNGLEWIRFVVSDTGIGIPDDKIDLIFKEFSQADETTTRDFGGTGLGLALTRRFCEMMGGTISVESEPGVGSRFFVEVPAVVEKKLENLEKEAVIEERSAHTEALDEASAGSAAATFKGKANDSAKTMVLVIDDEADARDLLRRHLESEGYAVVTARDGHEGLAVAASLRPSLITLDAMMPRMDGWATLRQLKANPDLKHIPVVMVSIVGDKTMSYALGAVEALQKPVNRKRLDAVVARYAQSPVKTALVVEDDPAARSIVKRYLESANWHVEEAQNGAVAADKTSTKSFGLILLDLMMPVMDGFEFLQQLRQGNGPSAKSPVVVVTAKDLTAEDRERLLQSVEHVVSKSGRDIEEVITDVRKSLTTIGVETTSDGNA